MIQRYIIPLFIVLLATSVGIFYIEPKYKDIGRLLGNAEVLRGYIADADNARAKLDEIARQYSEFPPEGVDRLKVLLPPKIDNMRLITDINNVAWRHGLTVLSPNVTMAAANSKKTTKSLVVPYTMDFQVSATYDTFYEFLADLEQSLALRDFVSVEFGAESVSEVAGKGPQKIIPPERIVYNFQVTIVSYGLH